MLRSGVSCFLRFKFLCYLIRYTYISYTPNCAFSLAIFPQEKECGAWTLGRAELQSFKEDVHRLRLRVEVHADGRVWIQSLSTRVHEVHWAAALRRYIEETSPPPSWDRAVVANESPQILGHTSRVSNDI